MSLDQSKFRIVNRSGSEQQSFFQGLPPIYNLLPNSQFHTHNYYASTTVTFPHAPPMQIMPVMPQTMQFMQGMPHALPYALAAPPVHSAPSHYSGIPGWAMLHTPTENPVQPRPRDLESVAGPNMSWQAHETSEPIKGRKKRKKATEKPRSSIVNSNAEAALSSKQRKIYKFICTKFGLNSQSPTHAEIAAKFKIKEQDVAEVLQQLEFKKLISIIPNELRGISLVDQSESFRPQLESVKKYLATSINTKEEEDQTQALLLTPVPLLQFSKKVGKPTKPDLTQRQQPHVTFRM